MTATHTSNPGPEKSGTGTQRRSRRLVSVTRAVGPDGHGHDDATEREWRVADYLARVRQVAGPGAAASMAIQLGGLKDDDRIHAPDPDRLTLVPRQSTALLHPGAGAAGNEGDGAAALLFGAMLFVLLLLVALAMVLAQYQ